MRQDGIKNSLKQGSTGRECWSTSKRLTFDHTSKWYVYKLETVKENETHEIHCDFEKHKDHLILVRRSDLAVIIKKMDASWILHRGFCILER